MRFMFNEFYIKRQTISIRNIGLVQFSLRKVQEKENRLPPKLSMIVCDEKGKQRNRRGQTLVNIDLC